MVIIVIIVVEFHRFGFTAQQSLVKKLAATAGILSMQCFVNLKQHWAGLTQQRVMEARDSFY